MKSVAFAVWIITFSKTEAGERKRKRKNEEAFTVSTPAAISSAQVM